MDMNNEKILAALAALGSNAYEIAETLREKGIKGDPAFCATCPIAVYLSRKLPTAKFFVTIHSVTWHARSTFASGGMDLPSAIKGFVRRFDDGEFDFLRSTHYVPVP